MKLTIFCLFVLVSVSRATSPCLPLWPRIFYGQSIKTSSSNQKLTVYFNTFQPCLQSYLQVVARTGMTRVQCQTTSLSLSEHTNNYQAYIHKCTTDVIRYDETFLYNLFGWDGSASNPTSFGDFISAKLADPFNKERQIKLAFLADWSQIQLNIKKYTPVTDMLKRLQSEQQINGLVILGDIGYDLDTNNCSNYEKFFELLSDVASSIPIITVTGNHEYNSKDNWQLFTNSLELYGLDTQLAVGLTVGSLYLAAFDPYDLLYGVVNKTEDKTAPRLDKILTQSQNQGRFVLPMSHYPLACSGTSKNCADDETAMSNYWTSMINHGVSLYLGSHYHTYQRLYPYLQDGSFSNQAENYSSDGNYLISIVEGVAGNDKDIVESIKKIKDFTAAYTVNETGFGILEATTDKIVYRHLSTKQGQMDKITIKRVNKQPNKKNLLTE